MILNKAVHTYWSAYQARRRRAALPPLLAQDFESMASALRAGSSFQQAVQVAARQGGLLALEWNTLIKDVQMGAPLSSALHQLEVRVPLPAVRSFASCVAILQETGGNLAFVLLTLAETLRQEIAFQNKLKAMTAQGRLSGYIVSALPFMLMVVLHLLAPDLMRPLFVTPLGWLMLLVVVVFIAIGGCLIHRIVTIEV